MITDNLVPWRARPNFRFDAGSAVLAGVHAGAIFPFVCFVARDNLHASETDLGLITAAPFVGNLLALFATQAISRRRPVLHICMVFWVARIIIVAASFASGSTAFAWTVFVVQLLAALPSPTYAAVLRAIYPQEARGRMLSYTRVGLAAGMMVSTLIAGPLMETVSWRWVFLAAAPVGLTGTYLFSRVRVPADQPVAEDTQVLRFVVGAIRLLKDDVAFRYYALAVFVYGFGNLLCTPVFTIYQVDVLHMSSGSLAMLMNTTQIVWVFAYMYWGRSIDRGSPIRVVLVNTALCALIPLNYILATQTWMLFPGCIVAGVVNAGIELSYFNAVMYFSQPETAAQYQGMHSLLLGIRGIIAPFVGASMAHSLMARGGDVRWVFALGTALIVVGAGLQWIGLKYAPRPGSSI